MKPCKNYSLENDDHFTGNVTKERKRRPLNTIPEIDSENSSTNPNNSNLVLRSSETVTLVCAKDSKEQEVVPSLKNTSKKLCMPTISGDYCARLWDNLLNTCSNFELDTLHINTNFQVYTANVDSENIKAQPQEEEIEKEIAAQDIDGQEEEGDNSLKVSDPFANDGEEYNTKSSSQRQNTDETIDSQSDQFTDESITITYTSHLSRDKKSTPKKRSSSSSKQQQQQQNPENIVTFGEMRILEKHNVAAIYKMELQDHLCDHTVKPAGMPTQENQFGGVSNCLPPWDSVPFSKKPLAGRPCYPKIKTGFHPFTPIANDEFNCTVGMPKYLSANNCLRTCPKQNQCRKLPAQNIQCCSKNQSLVQKCPKLQTTINGRICGQALPTNYCSCDNHICPNYSKRCSATNPMEEYVVINPSAAKTNGDCCKCCPCGHEDNIIDFDYTYRMLKYVQPDVRANCRPKRGYKPPRIGMENMTTYMKSYEAPGCWEEVLVTVNEPQKHFVLIPKQIDGQKVYRLEEECANNVCCQCCNCCQCCKC